MKEEKSSSCRRCEVVTRLKDDDGNTILDEDKVTAILAEKAHIIKDFAWIIHDHDTYTEEDEKKNPDHKAGEVKPKHIHLLLRFEEKQPQHYKNVAQWFSLEDNFVERIKGRWEDAVLYLVHYNAPEKYQYNPDDIVANFNAKKVINSVNDRKYLNQILQRILDGEIREYNKTLEIDNLSLVYHGREIKEAFKIRADHLQATQQSRKTEVIFITGSSGSGKTTLAKKIATERKLDYYVSAGSNDVMDGYAQQPCLILDDIRPSCLGLSDLLKLLDNHTASLVKSRYKNKYLNCDLIILTSVLDINQFYSNVFERENEPITQLKRRCGTYIQMDSATILISRWDNAEMKYSPPRVFPNDILTQYVTPTPKSKETVLGEIQQLIPFLTWDENLEKAVLTPKKETKKSAKATPPEPNPNESASDEAFFALMPVNKGGEPDG